MRAVDEDALRRQRRVGLALAGLLIGAWLIVHVATVWGFRFGRDSSLLVPAAIALQTWLCVGLFIVAHDCMHGSLAPFRPRINLWIGRLALALYAALPYDGIVRKHFAHHRHPGSDHDPDFDAEHPRAFWPWYLQFMREYFSPPAFAVLTAALASYLLAGAPLANVLVFWAVPALLSSVQIFYFGTYLPHRHEDEAFDDEHRARSNDYPWLISLLTCFHFGYHHEHHRHPRVPWWQLPRLRASSRSALSKEGPA